MQHTANTPTTRFQALVRKNRAAGRLAAPAEPKQKMEQTGMRLWPEELAEAKALAAGEDRSAASFMRRVYLRGLAAYRADRDASTATQ